MNSFGKKSTAYICYLIINFWWYVSCVLGIVFPALMIYEYVKGTHPNSIMGITVPLDPSLITFVHPQRYDYLAIQSVQGKVDFEYILNHSPGTFILWAIFICVVIAMFLWGLFQLRGLLKSTVNEVVFSKKNIQRIKIIAILILLFEPLKWIEHHFILETLGNIIPKETADIHLYLPMPGNDWGVIVSGLLIFALAAVFEKGHDMYQELKLTV